MSGKRSWSLDVTSSRPRPQVAPPTSATRHPNASTSPTAAPRRASPTRHWLLLMSASSSPARGRRLLTPSARWTRTSTAAWWVRAARATLDLQCVWFCRFCWSVMVFCLFSYSSGDLQCTFAIRSLWLKQTQLHTKQVKSCAEFVAWAKAISECSSHLIVELVSFHGVMWTVLDSCICVQVCCVGTPKRTMSPSHCLSQCLCSACPWGLRSSAGLHTPNTPCQFFPLLYWRGPLEKR